MNQAHQHVFLYRFIKNGREIKAIIADPLKTRLLQTRSTKIIYPAVYL